MLNRQHGAKNLASRADFLARVNGVKKEEHSSLMESDSSVEFCGAIRSALIVNGPENKTTRNNICIKTFLITSVYSIVKLLFTSIGSFTYAENVLYMLFFVSCIHSLKKSQ